MSRHEGIRAAAIVALGLMVARGIFWLLAPHPDATTGQYAVEILTVAICAVTAWATLRPAPGVQEALHRILGIGGR